jgi:hypothetical protein
MMTGPARRGRNGCSPSLGGLTLQVVLANPRAPDSIRTSIAALITQRVKRRYRVQPLDVHHRIRGHSERVAMLLRLARESTREHTVDSEQYNAPVLALAQGSNDFNSHKSDFTQIHE